MIKRKYMRTRQLKPGMKLDHPVVDRLGRNLVARGAELDEYMIDSMIKMGIMTVYIQDGEITDEVEQKLGEHCRRHAGDDNKQAAYSENDDRRDRSRKKCDQYVQHDRTGRAARVYMRRRSNS